MSTPSTKSSTKSSTTSNTASKTTSGPNSARLSAEVGVTGKGAIGTPETGEQKRKHHLKRLFFRFKESIGMVEKTEVSKAFTQSLKHLDKYKSCLDILFDALCAVIQENPAHRKQAEMTSPPNQERNELVAECLRRQPGFEDYKNQNKQIDLYEKQGSEEREYVRKARLSINSIRTFIQHDYCVIRTNRTELDTLRREMDFAKSELKAAKDEQLVAVKNQLYNMAVTAFEDKLKQVTALVDELPKNKTLHFADLEEWVSCTLKYHQHMAEINGELEKP